MKIRIMVLNIGFSKKLKRYITNKISPQLYSESLLLYYSIDLEFISRDHFEESDIKLIKSFKDKIGDFYYSL